MQRIQYFDLPPTFPIFPSLTSQRLRVLEITSRFDLASKDFFETPISAGPAISKAIFASGRILCAHWLVLAQAEIFYQKALSKIATFGEKAAFPTIFDSLKILLNKLS